MSFRLGFSYALLTIKKMIAKSKWIKKKKIRITTNVIFIIYNIIKLSHCFTNFLWSSYDVNYEFLQIGRREGEGGRWRKKGDKQTNQ